MQRSFLELGRSMVEMLGVLAVIGVLSIVGIAGYKKAMNKMRVNELLHLATIVYNNAVMKETLGLNAGYPKAQSFLLATNWPASKTNNMGMAKPTWATFNAFNIDAQIKPNQDDQSYDVIELLATGSCDLCFEMENMLTKPSGTVTYRYLPSGAENGRQVRVNCYAGLSTDTHGNSCPCYSSATQNNNACKQYF